MSVRRTDIAPVRPRSESPANSLVALRGNVGIRGASDVPFDLPAMPGEIAHSAWRWGISNCPAVSTACHPAGDATRHVGSPNPPQVDTFISRTWVRVDHWVAGPRRCAHRTGGADPGEGAKNTRNDQKRQSTATGEGCVLHTLGNRQVLKRAAKRAPKDVSGGIANSDTQEMASTR